MRGSCNFGLHGLYTAPCCNSVLLSPSLVALLGGASRHKLPQLRVKALPQGPPLSVSALPWGAGVPAAGKMVGSWENLLPPVPAFYVDNTQIISILSSEAKFLVCMMLFALAIQRSYMAMDMAARFKDPNQASDVT